MVALAGTVSRSVSIRLTWFQFHGLQTRFAQSVKYSLESWNWKLVVKQFRPFCFGVIFILPNKVSVLWQPLPELSLGLSLSDWLGFNFTDCGRFLRNASNLFWSLETKNWGWNNSALFFLRNFHFLTFCTILLPKNRWKWKIGLRQPIKNSILYGLTEANFSFSSIFW